MGNQSSYSAKLITTWLDDDQRKFTYKFSTPQLDSYAVVQTGLSVRLNDHINMSIQTDPRICITAFAETALQANNGIIDCEELGYSDVDIIRHCSPEDLFAHITQVMELIKAKESTFGSDIFPMKISEHDCESEGEEDEINGTTENDDTAETQQ